MQEEEEFLELRFRQPLAFTAKGVRKRSITKTKSICEANLRWILDCYWNGVNSNFLEFFHNAVHGNQVFVRMF